MKTPSPDVVFVHIILDRVKSMDLQDSLPWGIPVLDLASGCQPNDVDTTRVHDPAHRKNSQIHSCQKAIPSSRPLSKTE